MNQFTLKLINPIKHAKYMLSKAGGYLDLESNSSYFVNFVIVATFFSVFLLLGLAMAPAFIPFTLTLTSYLALISAGLLYYDWITLKTDYFETPERLVTASKLAKESRIQEILDDPAIDHPESLCCPITQTLMNFPIRGRDGKFYEFEDLKKWYDTTPNAHYPMNPNIEIRYPDIYANPIDKDKYLEIQHYKRCLLHRDNQKSIFKSLKAVGEYGRVGAGMFFVITCPLGYWGATGIATGLGFLIGTGLYYRDRYADLALENKRQQVEIRRNASAPPEDSDAYRAGLAASDFNVPYVKAFIPLFREGRLAWGNPREWYAGLQEGTEQTTAKRCITPYR